MSIRDLLPRKFRNVEAFDDLMNVMQQMSQENIWDAANHVINLREPQKIDPYFLTMLGSMLGLNVRSNLFSEADFRRIIREIVTYWSVSGTRYFGFWLGYMEGGNSRIKLLWSNDYKQFLEAPAAGTIYDGTGDWFITPHVNLYLSAGVYYDYAEIEHMFYQFAPIPLVLEEVEVPILADPAYLNVLLFGTPKITILAWKIRLGPPNVLVFATPRIIL